MKKMLALMLMGMFSMVGCSKSEREGKVDITFEVTAPEVAPEDSVFIVGSCAELGEWQPDVISLTRKTADTWEQMISLPYGARVEYKFTLGSWAREALDEQGAVPPNYQLAATRSQRIKHTVARWRAATTNTSTVTGDVRYHRQVTGEGIAPRDVVVWLPPGYEQSGERYPVLYMHDGQNLFDASTSFIGIEWGMDETGERLIREGAMSPVIIVGIYNAPQRADEYGLTELGQKYQAFVVDVVKPLMDSTYRTKPGRDETATMGSSMGGLVSFLLAWNYPLTFRQAACLSPAFFPEAVDLIRHADSIPEGFRMYMDNGTEGLEQKLQVFCDDMRAVLPHKGLIEGETFAWFLDPGAEHNEAAWAARVERPLRFLFGSPKP